MHIELHRNNVYQGVELLLLVPMLFLLAILKCHLIFKENFYYTSIYIYTREIWEKDYSGEGQGVVWMHGGYSLLLQCMCEHQTANSLLLQLAD